ncbi:MAG: DUF2341 domain-containing protein [Pseudomonadota bacterium]
MSPHLASVRLLFNSSLLLAGLGCPATALDPGQLGFACSQPEHCVTGYRCVDGECVRAAAGIDAAATHLDTGAITLDGPGLDHPMSDRPQLDGPFSDASTPDAWPADHEADGAVPVDSTLDDRSGQDGALRDGAATDAVASDAQALDQPSLFDVTHGDQVGPDASSGDVGASESGPADLNSGDLGPADTGTGDTAAADAGAADQATPDAASPDSTDASIGDSSTVPPDWWDPAWRTRRKLVLDTTGSSQEHNDVPVLVLLAPARIDYGKAQDRGQDLRFTLPDGTGPLAHEIERWDEAGQSVVWVRVPQLLANSTTAWIWMYYDNPTAADRQRASDVWSNGYVGVWHMDADPTAGAGSVRDSSSTGAHGTCLNMAANASVDGRIGRGLQLDGSNDIIAIEGSAGAGHALDIVGGPMTLSAWIYADGPTGTLIGRRRDSAVQWQLQIGENTNNGEHSIDFLWATASNAQNLWSTTGTFPRPTWRLVTVVVNASGTPAAFFTGNNARPFSMQSGASGIPVHQDVDVALGARWAGSTGSAFPFHGVLDEVRIDKVARSADWVYVQHRSMIGDLVVFDAVESLP